MAEALTKQPGRIAGNPNTGIIKLIAVFFMLIDHAAILFFKNAPFYTEMRLFGRIAMPLFAWGIVIGSEYTHNILLYAARVLAAAFLIQFLYMPVMHHDWQYLSIFFTLALGLFGIAGIRLRWAGSQFWAPILALLVPFLLQMLPSPVQIDYGWKGVALVLCLYACRQNRGAIAAMMCFFCLFWGVSSSSAISTLFGVTIRYPSAFSSLLNYVFRLQFFAILSLPIILYPAKHSLHIPKWISYSIYPAHLVLLYLVGLAVRA
ncbi:MAG: hypothetical protein IJ174_01675 [Clostridia bacterium]|nr:hypothetical protein [Clostridia bacterium]